MKSYLVTVSEHIRKDYLVHAKNEKQARENYKDGEESNYTCLEEMVVEVEQLKC